MNNTTKILGTLGTGAIGATIIALGIAFQNASFPEHKGVTYLEERGYSEIEGGNRTHFFHGCGKATARSYTAIHPNTGQRVPRNVCHDLIIGAHAPLLGMRY
jgi:hypothetical protein